MFYALTFLFYVICCHVPHYDVLSVLPFDAVCKWLYGKKYGKKESFVELPYLCFRF